MNPGLVVKLRPAGPWRTGPDSGARNRVDPIYHSDSLYAAVTAAMSTLGMRDEWLDATARHPESPAVRFSSCFPFVGEVSFIVPPRSIWPPMGGAPVSAAKVRWKSARFVPVSLVAAILDGQALQEEQWTVDGVSECLLPAGCPGPFRTSVRWNAAIDRLTGSADRHATACIEFRQDAGLWAIVSFGDEERHARWAGPVRGALKLLTDSGFGGERSRGWGRSAQPEFVEGALPDMILPRAAESPARPLAPPQPQLVPDSPAPEPIETAPEAGSPTQHDEGATPPQPEPDSPTPEPIETAPETGSPARPLAPPPAQPQPRADRATSHWLLSLFTPGPDDAVDWKRGNYTVVARGGRIESSAGFGERKKQLQMVAEGSVLVAGEAIRGMAPDVAPDGFAHPVFRAGFALSIPLPSLSRDREGAV
jgi:CRISPR type III-A-associated RAMP protein Csm4